MCTSTRGVDASTESMHARQAAKFGSRTARAEGIERGSPLPIPGPGVDVRRLFLIFMRLYVIFFIFLCSAPW